MKTDQEINDLIRQMSLEEKVSLLSGATGWTTTAIERLGIRSLSVTDGPHGANCSPGKTTCFPTSVGMAATWNPDLIREVGAALGRETLAAGRDVLLGPCVNIQRHPLGGRNFESFSEDPHLAARMAVAYIQGVQGEGAGTSVKHFAANNQEFQRNTINVEVDERTLREIYLPAFEAAVREAGAWTAMAAYNRVNGPFCCENRHLLVEILKEEWGFDGFVVSDWGACHSTVESANGGMDLEMDADGPGQRPHFRQPLVDAVKQGKVPEALVDDKVRRVLRVLFRIGQPKPVDLKAHAELAKAVAREGLVLLKNERATLPLNPAAIKTLAVIGPNAPDARLGGEGSSSVTPAYSVSVLDGIRNFCGDRVSVRTARGAVLADDLKPIEPAVLLGGLRAEYFNNLDLAGAPDAVRTEEQVDLNSGMWPPAPGIRSHRFSVRWTGKLRPTESGRYHLGMTKGEKTRLYLDGKPLMDHWQGMKEEERSVEVDLDAGREYDVRGEYCSDAGWGVTRLAWLRTGDLLADAVAAARAVDAAVLVVGLSRIAEGEGFDRRSLNLPGGQDELIAAVAKANPNTVVLIIGGSPVAMDRWLSLVPAVVQGWYPGQEGGNAVAEVLFGAASPSGRLPLTFPRRIEDSSAHANYPGQNGKVTYQEGIFVGYRHFDTRGIEPLFPFGHGLSYTTFEYRDLEFKRAGGDGLRVSFRLRNTGARDGAEVAQLYVRDTESSVERPAKELRAMRKIFLKAGDEAKVEFELGPRAFAFYDTGARRWIVEPGEFEILVGSSSRDLRLKGRVTI
jgi:beta-glucosidase